MLSIFEKIDQQANPSLSFWTPLESFVLQDITENHIFTSPVKMLKKNGQWKDRTIILTACCLYYCRKYTNSPKVMSIIKWKKIEAFTEDNQVEERYIFKLGHGYAFQEFYTETMESLEIWLSKLSSVAIMSEFEDDYTIIKNIGKGNYASVYLAQDLETRKEFAVKIIHKEEMQKKSRGIDAVISEIEIMRKLNHPGLVALHRIYENDEFVYLILDFAEGGDLFHRIQKKEKLSEAIAANLITNLLEGLRYLHSLNIVHRDIKPQNILLLSNEVDFDLKICDFGLACLEGNDQALRCGSPGYMAPEILNKRSYNTKVDIFSAGIILYIILSGRAPFYGTNSNEILVKNKECRLQFHGRCWGQVSQEGIDFLLKLTDPDPNSRFSAEQALRHPWLHLAERPTSMTLLSPIIDQGITGGSPESGASFALMQRINDRREVGAQVMPSNPLNPEEVLQESKKAKGLLQKLRRDDLHTN